ncbi:MAG: hypothetical protein ACXVCY_12310 [Pseudobdellovibrionaceae bacterium]
MKLKYSLIIACAIFSGSYCFAKGEACNKLQLTCYSTTVDMKSGQRVFETTVTKVLSQVVDEDDNVDPSNCEASVSVKGSSANTALVATVLGNSSDYRAYMHLANVDGESYGGAIGTQSIIENLQLKQKFTFVDQDFKKQLTCTLVSTEDADDNYDY